MAELRQPQCVIIARNSVGLKRITALFVQQRTEGALQTGTVWQLRHRMLGVLGTKLA